MDAEPRADDLKPESVEHSEVEHSDIEHSDIEHSDIEHWDIEHLSPAECWALLRTASLGRVAVVRDGTPDVFPVNHVVDHGTIVYRTSAGELFAATLNHEVAFEVDGLEIDGPDQNAARAWSVVLRGRASEGHRIEDLLSTLSLAVASWQPGAKPRFIRIEPREITGRRFRVLHPDTRHTRHATDTDIDTDTDTDTRSSHAHAH